MAKSTKDLIKMIRETVHFDRTFQPGARKNRAWPICLTCGREPHAVNLEDVGKYNVDVRVKCTHKANPGPNDREFEDVMTVTIPFGAERTEHISMALKNGRFFDPTKPEK